MFAKVLARLDEQDRKMDEKHAENRRRLEEIHTDVKTAQVRISILEVWRTEIKAKVGVFAAIISVAVGLALEWVSNRFGN